MQEQKFKKNNRNTANNASLREMANPNYGSQNKIWFSREESFLLNKEGDAGWKEISVMLMILDQQKFL